MQVSDRLFADACTEGKGSLLRATRSDTGEVLCLDVADEAPRNPMQCDKNNRRRTSPAIRRGKVGQTQA